MVEYYSINTLGKRRYRNNEQKTDGKGKKHAHAHMEIACYLVNISPSSVLEDKTPYEVWTSKKPSLSNLRVFGCDPYVHVPKEKITKFDSKSERRMFIGYNDGLKG